MSPSGPTRWLPALLGLLALGPLPGCSKDDGPQPSPRSATDRLADGGDRVRLVHSDVSAYHAPDPVELSVAADQWIDEGSGFGVRPLPWPPLADQVTVRVGDRELEQVTSRSALVAGQGFLLVSSDQTWTSEWLGAFLEGPPRPGQGGEPESLFLKDQEAVTLPLEVTGEDLDLRLAVFLPREVPVRLTVAPDGGEPLVFRVTKTGWQILEGSTRVPPGLVPTAFSVEPLGERPVPPRLLAVARIGVRSGGPDRVLVSGPPEDATSIRYLPRLPHPVMERSTGPDPGQETGILCLGGPVTVSAAPAVSGLEVGGQEVALDAAGHGTLELTPGLHLVRAPAPTTLTVEQPMARLQPFLLRAGAQEPTNPAPGSAHPLQASLESAGDRRQGLWLPPPSELRVALALEAGDRVRFSAALLDPPVRDTASHDLTWTAPVDWQPVGARARVRVGWAPGRGAAQTLLDAEVEAPGWQDVDWVTPADAAGRGELILSTSASPRFRDVAVGVADLRVVHPGGSRPKWNVLLYLVDTLRADGLSSYGARHPTSPVLDRIAAEGYRFARVHAVASWTRPSAASILTGLYPAYHGILTAQNGLSPELSTLAEVLQGAGYSNWAGVANIQVSARGVQFDQGFHRFLGVQGLDIEHPELQTDPSSKRVHDAFLPWLERYGDEPFFLYLHTMDPHMPYLPPPGYQGRFDPDYAGVLADQPLTDVSVIWRQVASLEERDVAFVRSRYDEEVRYQDEEFGRLWRHLEESGQLARTIVMVVSDHGEEFFEHQRFSHQGRMWEELLHVPLILWVPPALRERLGPPRVIQEPLSQVDLLPTLLDLAGVEDPALRQGRSVVPLLAGEPWEDAARFAQEGDQLGAVLAGPWKLVWRQAEGQDRTFELYHREDDPAERHDLAAERPEVVERLWEQLHDWQVRQAARGLPTREGQVAPFDLDALEELRALGYLK